MVEIDTRPPTPDECRALELHTGITFAEITTDPARFVDLMQAIVWITLHRGGYEPTWEDAGGVVVLPPGWDGPR